MENIILVDDIPFSEKIHRWYSEENLELFSVDWETWDNEIKVFNHIMPVYNYSSKHKKYLKELNCFEFFSFVKDVMFISDGLSKENSIQIDFTYEDIKIEVHKIKRGVIYWALIEGLPLSKFGNLEPYFLEEEKKRTSKTFHYKFYYVIKNIEHKVQELGKTLADNNINDMKDLKITSISVNSPIYHGKFRKIMSMIRTAYAGDLENFIAQTMNKIQFFTMNKYHEKLAQFIRYRHLELPDFTEKMAHTDIWRFLYHDYFDKYEDIFDDFVGQFPSESVEYYLEDYLNSSFDIIKIPFYDVYFNKCTGECHDNMITLVNIEQLEQRKRHLYDTHVFTSSYE